MNSPRLMTAIGTLCLLGLAACSTTKVEAPPEPTATMDVQEDPGKIAAEQTVTVSATVKDIDQKTRMVTLLGADGETVTFRAGEQVRNLPQVRRGDIVQVTYFESIAIEVKKPGEATPGVTTAADFDRAKVGAKPGAAGAESTRMVATVVKVDRKHQSVTLKGPRGNVRTIPVRNPIHLDKVKVGDLVEVTYTEAVAIAVEPPAKN